MTYLSRNRNNRIFRERRQVGIREANGQPRIRTYHRHLWREEWSA